MATAVSPLAVTLPELPPLAGVRLAATEAASAIRDRTDVVMIEARDRQHGCRGIHLEQMPRRSGRLVPGVAEGRQSAVGGGECGQRERLHWQGRARRLRRNGRGRREAGRVSGAAGIRRFHRRDR